MSLNSSSKVRFSVSVKMYDPATNATPRMTAKADRPRRSLRAARFLRVARSIASAHLAHGVGLLEAVEHPLGGRLEHLVHKSPVGEEQHPIGVCRGVRVVGHHHDGLAELSH